MFDNFRKQGWTLIELLIVLFILATLSTLVIPSLIDVTQKADRMASSQLLLEALASVKLEMMDGSITLEQSCHEFYERERVRFQFLELSIGCDDPTTDHIVIKGSSEKSGSYQLSSLYGFQ